MNTLSDLALIGFGYLQEVVIINNQTIARLYRLSINDSERGEAMTLNCVITDSAIKAKLAHYQAELEHGSAVIVKFAAHYLETTSFHNCISEDDPDHILCISAKLIAISEIFVDGVKLPVEENIKLIANL